MLKFVNVENSSGSVPACGPCSASVPSSGSGWLAWSNDCHAFNGSKKCRLSLVAASSQVVLYPSLSIFIHLYPVYFISPGLPCDFWGKRRGTKYTWDIRSHLFALEILGALEFLLFDVFLGQTLTDGLWPHEFEHVLTKAYIRIYIYIYIYITAMDAVQVWLWKPKAVT